MPCSPEQRAANQKNATRSTGPKTAEGKARARANSLKHGLTGEGIVIPEEDRAEVDRRADSFEYEFKPISDSGRFLIRRAAMLSVRLDRSVQQEFAAVAKNVREAPGLFDEARRLEVERLMKALLEDPTESVRQLQQSPEGIDALLGSFAEVRANLLGTGLLSWDGAQCYRLKRLMGRDPKITEKGRIDVYAHAAFGNFSFIKPEDGGGLSDPDRKAWGRNQLLQLIDQEMTRLREVRENFDFETIALDRAESADRALFDPSKPAERARKYEAATERNFFRTMKEYRQAEADVIAILVSEEEEEVSEELASSFPEPVIQPPTVVPTPRSIPTERFFEVPNREQPVVSQVSHPHHQLQ